MNRMFYQLHGRKLNFGLIRLLVFLSVNCLLLYTVGCTGTVSGPIFGTVSYQLKLKEANALSERMEMINCETKGVKDFYAYVYERDSMVPVAQKSWSCPGRPKSIHGVQNGENLKVVVVAMDKTDKVLFIGEKDNIQVRADTINNIGDIELIRFLTNLDVKTDDNLLSWPCVKFAKQYRIQIAENIKFTNIVVNKILETAYYAPGLESTQVYFWRVAAINSTGIEGRFSAIYSFRF